MIFLPLIVFMKSLYYRVPLGMDEIYTWIFVVVLFCFLVAIVSASEIGFWVPRFPFDSRLHPTDI